MRKWWKIKWKLMQTEARDNRKLIFKFRSTTDDASGTPNDSVTTSVKKTKSKTLKTTGHGWVTNDCICLLTGHDWVSESLYLHIGAKLFSLIVCYILQTLSLFCLPTGHDWVTKDCIHCPYFVYLLVTIECPNHCSYLLELSYSPWLWAIFCKHWTLSLFCLLTGHDWVSESLHLFGAKLFSLTECSTVANIVFILPITIERPNYCTYWNERRIKSLHRYFYIRPIIASHLNKLLHDWKTINNQQFIKSCMNNIPICKSSMLTWWVTGTDRLMNQGWYVRWDFLLSTSSSWNIYLYSTIL